MDSFTRDDLKTLTERRERWLVSLYLPTHRSGQDVPGDRIRLKNLLRAARDRLRAARVRRPDVEALLAPATALVDDERFWRYQADGLAVFCGPGGADRYRLPVSFPEVVTVGDRFHIKPLLPLLTDDGRFFLLAISQNMVRLFDATRHGIAEVPLENVPRSLDEALRFDDPQKQLQFHTGAQSAGGRRAAMFHGHGTGIDDAKDNVLRFFHLVDEGLKSVLPPDGGAPLVLAAVDYLHPIYREASAYARILEPGVIGNPDALAAKDLHERALPIVEAAFRNAREAAAAHFRERHGTGRASNDLRDVVRAAHHGRVDTLFVAVGQQRWGIVDDGGEIVRLHRAARAGNVDLLDDAAVHALLNGGAVYAVPPAEIPQTDGGDELAALAAIYRY